MKNPNLFLIGAMKSGTTSMYYYLEQHPEITFSKKKEPHFFSLNGTMPQYNGNGDMEIASQMMSFDESEYQSLFDHVDKEKYLGDASAMYLYLNGTAENIHKANPDAKILIMLREPVARAYSSYMHLRRDGRENITDFREALTKEQERIENNWMPIWHYTKASKYYEQVKKYIDLFGDKNVKIITYESFAAHTHDVCKRVIDWLELSQFDDLSTETHYNRSGIPSHKWLHNFLRKEYPIKTFFKNLIPSKYREYIKTTIINKNLHAQKPLSTDVKEELKTLFHADIKKLEGLIHQDLSQWH